MHFLLPLGSNQAHPLPSASQPRAPAGEFAKGEGGCPLAFQDSEGMLGKVKLDHSQERFDPQPEPPTMSVWEGGPGLRAGG